MVTQEVTINNEVGLHARPATFFIQKAKDVYKRQWRGAQTAHSGKAPERVVLALGGGGDALDLRAGVALGHGKQLSLIHICTARAEVPRRRSAYGAQARRQG